MKPPRSDDDRRRRPERVTPGRLLRLDALMLILDLARAAELEVAALGQPEVAVLRRAGAHGCPA